MSEAVQIKLALDNKQLSADLARANAKIDALGKKTVGTAEKMGVAIGAAIRTFIVPTAVISGVFALGNAIKETSKAVADLNDKALSLGVSFKTIQVLQYAATQSGTSIDAVSTAIARLQKKIGELDGDVSGKANAFTKLGLSVDELKTKTDGELFEAVSRSLANLESRTDRAAISAELFGRGFRELNPLIDSMAQGIDAWTDAAERAGVVIDDLTKDKMAKMDDGVEQLSIRWTVFKANALVPVVDYLNNQFAIAMDDSIGYLEKMRLTFNGMMKANPVLDFIQIGGDYVTKKPTPKPKLDGAENAAFDAMTNLNLKLQADDEKRNKKLKESGAKAAKAFSDGFKESLDSAKSDAADAVARFNAFSSGGQDALDALEKQIALREKLASLTAKITDPTKIKAIEAELILEQEKNDALAERILLEKQLAEQFADDFEQAQRDTDEWMANNERQAEQMKTMWTNVGMIIGDAFGNIITGSESAGEALRGLLELLLKAIAQAAILAAFGQGSFSSNLGGFFGGGSGRSSGGGANVRVYNYGNTGGVQTQTSANGDLEIIIGRVAQSITRGGNPIDQALRRTYGIGRIGK